MIENIMINAQKAFEQYRQLSFSKRKDFLFSIAEEMEQIRSEIVQQASIESNLTELRLHNELNRTIFQLKSYSEAAERGDWLNVSIDTADKDRNPPKPDLRKTYTPLGVVLVFAASNFPLAYSTAGGDTASALAAGCVVIQKAHQAHIKTSTIVAEAIARAIKKHQLPEAVFQHIIEDKIDIIHQIITHPILKAIGFTGSFVGGKAIWELANSRPEPIPVFAEMSSINPIFIFPEKLNNDLDAVALNIANSITLGAGQFCTNPGLIIVRNSEKLQLFIEKISTLIAQTKPVNMLHNGIARFFKENRNLILAQPHVTLLAENNDNYDLHDIPSLAKTTAYEFLNNKLLLTEVFGSFSLMVVCDDDTDFLEIAKRIPGQLTCAVMMSDNESTKYKHLIEEITFHCGRIIFNGVPTSVEVCQAMNHGGPWPSTTNSFHTSVGSDALKRFVKFVSYQNFPQHLLPLELQNENPLNINRTVNNVLTKDPIK